MADKASYPTTTISIDLARALIDVDAHEASCRRREPAFGPDCGEAECGPRTAEKLASAQRGYGRRGLYLWLAGTLAISALLAAALTTYRIGHWGALPNGTSQPAPPAQQSTVNARIAHDVQQIFQNNGFPVHAHYLSQGTVQVDGYVGSGERAEQVIAEVLRHVRGVQSIRLQPDAAILAARAAASSSKETP